MRWPNIPPNLSDAIVVWLVLAAAILMFGAELAEQVQP